MKCPKCKVKITYKLLEDKKVQVDGVFDCDSCDSVLIYLEDELCERGIEGMIALRS